MPAGPDSSAPITSGSITTGANSVTMTSPLFSTGSAKGMLITVLLSGTPSATQTITAKLYQGNGTSGTQVNPSAGTVATFTGTTSDTKLYQWIDTSAFAQNASAAQYTVGFTGNTGTNTILYAAIELETLSPVS